MSAACPRRDLAEVLLSLGACSDTPRDAVPWARPYGGDWERAVAECPWRNWLLWLAQDLLARGHLKREAIAAMACACALAAVKRAIGPALIAGLEAYAATLPGASR